MTQPVDLCVLINMADGQGNLSSAYSATQEKLAESLSSFANDDTSRIGELIGSTGRLTEDSLTNEEEKVLRFIKEIEREFVVTSLADGSGKTEKLSCDIIVLVNFALNCQLTSELYDIF